MFFAAQSIRTIPLGLDTKTFAPRSPAASREQLIRLRRLRLFLVSFVKENPVPHHDLFPFLQLQRTLEAHEWIRRK